VATVRRAGQTGGLRGAGRRSPGPERGLRAGSMGSERAEGGMALATSFTQPPGRRRAGGREGSRVPGSMGTGRIRGEPALGRRTGVTALALREGKSAIWRPAGGLASSREAGDSGLRRRRGTKAGLLRLGAGQAGLGRETRTETGLIAGRLAGAGEDPAPSGLNRAVRQ
jgi:hypothetical protein